MSQTPLPAAQARLYAMTIGLTYAERAALRQAAMRRKRPLATWARDVLLGETRIDGERARRRP